MRPEAGENRLFQDARPIPFRKCARFRKDRLKEPLKKDTVPLIMSVPRAPVREKRKAPFPPCLRSKKFIRQTFPPLSGTFPGREGFPPSFFPAL